MTSARLMLVTIEPEAERFHHYNLREQKSHSSFTDISASCSNGTEAATSAGCMEAMLPSGCCPSLWPGGSD